MKNLNLGYWVHWLAYGFMLDDVKKFEAFLALCKKNGVEGVELPWTPLLGLDALQLSMSLRKHGITKIALCIFFGQVDPLDRGEGRRTALSQIESAMKYIAKLRSYGIEVVCIDGPFAYQIEKQYQTLMTGRVLPFLRAVAKLASKYKVLCCIESLRPEENMAIGGARSTIQLVEAVGSRWLKAHLDTFHIDVWGDKVIDVLVRAGSSLGWFHVSGSRRHTPGSRGDEINWLSVATALSRNRKENGEPITCVCFEAFSPAFRIGVPAIGAGFPVDLTPERAIKRARKTLQNVGIIA